MAERHPDPLFSAAYDDELDPAGRRRFDAHLDGCSRCAGAWDDYRAALDAVRALPAVAMPATVRLPAGPPQVEQGWSARLARLRAALLHPQPVWAAGGLAAVALAAVVLAVHHPGGTSSTGGAGSVALRQGASQFNSDTAPRAPAGAPALMAPVPQALSAPPATCAPAAVAPAGASSAPAGFSHSASSTAPGGGQMVLATPADSYAPGASVQIYARLSGAPAGSGASDVVPCVTLLAPESSAAPGAAPAPAAPGNQNAQQEPGAASTVPPTPIAVATAGPAGGAGAAGSSSRKDAAPGPLLNVVIPPNIPSGTVLRLVAYIPPYAAGNPSGKPLEVELLITVR